MGEKKKELVTGVESTFSCEINTSIYGQINKDIRERMSEQLYIKYRAVACITNKASDSVARAIANVINNRDKFGKYPRLRMTVTTTIEPLDGEGNVI